MPTCQTSSRYSSSLIRNCVGMSGSSVPKPRPNTGWARMSGASCSKSRQLGGVSNCCRHGGADRKRTPGRPARRNARWHEKDQPDWGQAQNLSATVASDVQDHYAGDNERGLLVGRHRTDEHQPSGASSATSFSRGEVASNIRTSANGITIVSIVVTASPVDRRAVRRRHGHRCRTSDGCWWVTAPTWAIGLRIIALQL